jgi:PST family polysaccharide transporter
LFLTTAINVYYLPKLASTHERAPLLAELRLAYRYIMPAVLLLAVGIYVCRGWVTALLFSADFSAANSLYAPQLVGDVVKIASFVLSYVMLAKAMTRLFVASEFAFAISYVVLVYLFTARFGLVGAMYAFTVNYALYLVFNVIVVRRYLREL